MCTNSFFSKIINLRRRIAVDEKRFQRKQGELIRKYRKQKLLTIEEVARRVNMDGKYLGKLENGKHNPTSIVLFKLVAALDIPVSFFEDLKEEVKNLLEDDE